MTRTHSAAPVLASFIVTALAAASLAPGLARAGGDPGHAHLHAPLPPEYTGAHVPARVWTDEKMLARGKAIYAAKCVACHGEAGDGKGPAGTPLALKPADFTDWKAIVEMRGNYWFWRVSEGGAVEPYRGKGSAMPTWKTELSIADRWAVIAHTHTFARHGEIPPVHPHVPSVHPEMRHGH